MKNKSITSTIVFSIGFILLIAYSISFLIPFLWSINSAFKGVIDFKLDPLSIVSFKKINFANYKKAYELIKVPVSAHGASYYVGFWELIFNSLVYSILCTIMHVLTPCITAYAVARYNFKFSKVVYSIVIITMILPTIGNLASSIQVSKIFHTYDSFIGLAIMKGYFLGTNFLIFYAAFKSISNEYTEAAEIDGASQFQIMTTIILPLVKTTISAVALLTFISYWNDYYTPMIYLPSHPTIAYGLYYFNNSTNNEASFVTVRLAGCIMVSIPILVVFLFLKNKLTGNMTVGGLKG